ncbi:hypothetical protein PGC34_05920 [Pseudomonas kribbensis]|jgi:hypothetical protein|uniref:hypothetical protein n=1 Tax=Pseudomonas TaxID=286 RepID=UPI00200EB0CD|nr:MULTISPECIES: hypothetical protein [unclassified Pseudomonas]MDL5600598.1 hypothetical protein [Bacillus subtilis]
MIQCSAAGTLDLELGVLTHPGEQSFAMPAAAVFQHLQILLILRLTVFMPWRFVEAARIRQAFQKARH